MSGEVNRPDRDAGHAETLALVHAIIELCDGHDTAAVLAALQTVCAISLDDIGVDVEVFVKRIRIDAAKIKRAKRARKEAAPT
jgi:hypothetical protein